MPLAATLEASAGVGEFEHVHGLAKDVARVRGLLRDAGLGGLAETVLDGLEVLARQEAATGAELNDKLIMQEASFTMAYGDLELFYGGLTQLLGPPRMVRGSIQTSMECEHWPRRWASPRRRPSCRRPWAAAS